MAPRPAWERVLAIVQAWREAKGETFRNRHGGWGRDVALFWGRTACGLPLRRLGTAAGGRSDAAVSMAIQRFAVRLARGKPLRQMAESATQMLNVNA